MEQLNLASQYLKKRAVSTEGIKKSHLKIMHKVLPAWEVEEVLTMVMDGSFLQHHNRLKDIAGPDMV